MKRLENKVAIVTSGAGSIGRTTAELFFEQCPQSSAAIKNLIKVGYPADKILYYRGGMHDWITLGLPVQRF